MVFEEDEDWEEGEDEEWEEEEWQPLAKDKLFTFFFSMSNSCFCFDVFSGPSL